MTNIHLIGGEKGASRLNDPGTVLIDRFLALPQLIWTRTHRDVPFTCSVTISMQTALQRHD